MPWLFFALILFLLSATLGIRVIPHSLAAQVNMEVYEQIGHRVFGRSTSLDVFNNPKLGGRKLVAPFTEDTYTFAVRNTSSSNPLPYTLEIETDNPQDIPLVFSLQKNGKYVFGGSGTLDMLPFDGFTCSEYVLGGGQTDVYTLNWSWKTENDVIDTALGDDGTQLYTLTLTATGTMDESSVSPGTGDYLRIEVPLALLLVGGVFVTGVFIKRKKRDNEDTCDISENA